MKPIDKNTTIFGIKLIMAVSIAFIFIIVAPEHSHYLLLLISLVLCLVGAGAISQHRTQASWIETKAVLKRIDECEEEVSFQYGRLNYFYPEAQYEYSINGKKFIDDNVAYKKQDIWVAEYNQWGDKTPENKS
jgi:hypothetical protein